MKLLRTPFLTEYFQTIASVNIADVYPEPLQISMIKSFVAIVHYTTFSR